MSTFDPMAAAMDWLDTYRAASLTIVNLYSENASLVCDCGGRKILIGRRAITEYWRDEKPAGKLVDLEPDGNGIVVSYRVPGIVQAFLSLRRATLKLRNLGRAYWPDNQAIRRYPCAIPGLQGLTAYGALEAVHFARGSHRLGATVDGAAFAMAVLVGHGQALYADSVVFTIGP